MPRRLAQRLVEDETGEALVIGCRAAGVGISQLTSLLVLMPSGGGAVDSQAQIRNLVAIAEHLTPKVAAGFIAQWRTFGEDRQAQHEPVAFAGRSPSARGTARPAVRHESEDQERKAGGR